MSRIVAILVLSLILIMGIALSATHPPAMAQSAVGSIGNTAGISEDNTCQTILTQALSTLQDICSDVSRNGACYGHNNIQASLQDDWTLPFETPGDKVPIHVIKTLATSPMDVDTGAWGLSLLKLQANLPDTLPGQNVTFLVYGDTSIQNPDGAMHAFYFSSGLGNPECKAAPSDGIFVRSPNHTQVSFTVNGVKVSIASTIRLTASPNQTLNVQLIEGHATVHTAFGQQTLLPGQQVSVPMGGDNGLTATGAPSTPVDVPGDPTILPLFATADQVTGAKSILTISGCITSIDGNNVAVIDGYPVQLDPNNPATANLGVGSCVDIAGTVGNGNISIHIDPVTVTPDPTAGNPGNHYGHAYGTTGTQPGGKGGNAGGNGNGNAGGNGGGNAGGGGHGH